MIVWDEETKTYIIINEDGEEEPVPIEFMIALRNQLSDDGKEKARELALMLTTGEITLSEFVESMRELIRNVYVAQFMLGTGGASRISADQWIRIDNVIVRQYGFLQDFAAKVAAGLKTAGEIASNAALFLASSVQAFDIGRTEFAFELILPAYPGDGSSECRANDKCYWDIQETETQFLAYWTRTAQESCPTCIDRADNLYNPLVIDK